MYRFWGKYTQDTDDLHLLVYHSLDVSSVAELWLTKNIRLRNIFSNKLGLDETELINYIALLAGLHDIGKFSNGFQCKSHYCINKLNTPVCKDKGDNEKNFNHGAFGAYWLYNYIKSSNNPIIANIFNNNIKINQMLILSTCSHHGFIFNKEEYSSRDIKTFPYRQYEKSKDLDKIRVNFILTLAELFNITNIELNIEYVRPIMLFLAGFVSVCDWIGSNPFYFSYKEENEELDSYYKKSKDKAYKALEDSGLLYSSDDVVFNPIENIFNFKLRPVQENILNISSDYKFIIIEAPTGEGKTEAAYLKLMQYLKDLNMQGAFFALPTMATSNSMYNRTKHFLNNIIKIGKLNLELIHSSSWINDEYIETYSHLDTSDSLGNESGVTSQEWMHSSKRSLLSSFGVGTIDQAMTAALSIKHFFVKLFGLAKGVVIFDEIHAYDTYMNEIIYRLIEWLSSLDTPVILLTATLPETKKLELLKSYTNKEDITLKNKNYPLLTAVSKNNIMELGKMEAAIKRKVKLDFIEYDIENIWKDIKGKFKEGGCVCIIANTVKRCQHIYIELKNKVDKDTIIINLHSLFTKYDRNIIEKKIISLFGKNGNRPTKAIVVSTQVIEQSLDLDFDYMLSDIVPIDILIQRIGRLHRHINNRPLEFKSPSINIIIDKEGQNNPGLFVYNNIIILKTMLVLQNKTHIDIPFEVRELIDKVYEKKLMIEEKTYDLLLNNISINYNKERIKEWNQKTNEEILYMKQVANFFYITKPQEQNPINGVGSFLEDDNKNKTKLKAKTRLGIDTTECILLINKDSKIYTSDTLPIIDLANNTLLIHNNEDIQKSLFYSIIGLSKGKLEKIADYRNKNLEQKIRTLLNDFVIIRNKEILLLGDNISIHYNRELGLLLDIS